MLFFHSLYAFIAILVWSDWDFVDVGAPFATLYGPLLWHLTQMNKDIKHNLEKLKWHFLPFTIFSLGYIYCLIYPLDEVFILYYTKTLYLFAGVQFAFYLILSIVVMGKIKPTEEATRTPKEPFFNYLYILSTLTIFLFFTTSLDHFILDQNQSQNENGNYSIHLLLLGVSILFNLRLVKETHYIEFYDETQLLKNPNNKTNHTKEKYQTTINKRSYLETIAEKIQNAQMTLLKIQI